VRDPEGDGRQVGVNPGDPNTEGFEFLVNTENGRIELCTPVGVFARDGEDNIRHESPSVKTHAILSLRRGPPACTREALRTRKLNGRRGNLDLHRGTRVLVLHRDRGRTRAGDLVEAARVDVDDIRVRAGPAKTRVVRELAALHLDADAALLANRVGVAGLHRGQDVLAHNRVVREVLRRGERHRTAL